MSTVNSRFYFRPIGADESDILTHIHAEAFASYWNPGDFNDFFSVPGTHALLAEAEGQPAGMVVLRVTHEQSDIITIAVRPGFRRQGLALMLMRQCIENAKTLGANAMFLDVENGNLPALALYNALGFSQISRRKLYYRQKDGTYTDALVMTCKFA